MYEGVVGFAVPVFAVTKHVGVMTVIVEGSSNEETKKRNYIAKYVFSLKLFVPHCEEAVKNSAVDHCFVDTFEKFVRFVAMVTPGRQD